MLIYARHVAYKGSCCRAKLQHNCSSWNFNEDKKFALGMWSCSSRNDGEQSLRLDGVHPAQQTDLHFQESPQHQVVPGGGFHGSRRMLLSWGCQSQFWVTAGTTRQCWDDLPQPAAAVWDEVPQPPPATWAAQLKPPANFLGSEAHKAPSQGQSHSTVEVGVQERSAKSSQLYSMSQPSCSDYMSVALVM